MSFLAWYWHRLRAMDAAEIQGRIKKKLLETVDMRRSRDWTSILLKSGQTYPHLPNPKEAPDSLRKTLTHDMREIIGGKWRAFGHLSLQVTDPPNWHRDYLAGVDLSTNDRAFKLNHRSLPKSADIKLIWELSRWHQLTRLALATYVLDEPSAARKCVHWLEHWVRYNPPYRGWNWTSALESGIRLVQFTWIEALLLSAVDGREFEGELEKLRYDILAPHVRFTWRHRSFGSSANNHLLGELAGLIVSTVRWPEMSAWGAPLEELQAIWEREVLAQFAEDGGNREQALHYHLFSLELCWHTASAIRMAGRTISPSVEERLRLAAEFFRNVQTPSDPWDYGDSDDAFVLPLSADPPQITRGWLDGKSGPSSFFRSAPPEAPQHSGFKKLPQGWRYYPQTGIVANDSGECFLRFDVSPLGYLTTAAHGHFDALHLSIWRQGTAMVIDPGTGAYYSNAELRSWLASGSAHNGPHLPLQHTSRLGTFLWNRKHSTPTLAATNAGLAAELRLGSATLQRNISRSVDAGAESWVVEDRVLPGSPFTVRWQFAPETTCQTLNPRRFRIARHGRVLEILVTGDWHTVELVSLPPRRDDSFEGIVSAKFRQTTWAPYLKLVGDQPGNEPCVFQTVFLASHD